MAKKFTSGVAFLDYSSDDDETEIDLIITYTCTPAQAARGPSYASGGEPAEPAELEILDVTYEGGRAVSPELYQKIVDDHDIYYFLGKDCDWGVPYRDPDAARDAMRDRG